LIVPPVSQSLRERFDWGDSVTEIRFTTLSTWGLGCKNEIAPR